MSTDEPKIDRTTWLQLYCALLPMAYSKQTIEEAAVFADMAARWLWVRYPDDAQQLDEVLDAPRWGRVEVFGRTAHDALVTTVRRRGELGLRLELTCERGHVVMERWYSARAIYSDDYSYPEETKRRGERAANGGCTDAGCVAARQAAEAYEVRRRRIASACAVTLSNRGRPYLSSELSRALGADQATAGQYALPTEEEVLVLLALEEQPETAAARARWPRTAAIIAAIIAGDNDNDDEEI